MTELAPYVGARVHLHLHPLGVCETGTLSFRSGAIEISTLPGWRLPLDGWIVRPTPFGPAETPYQADVYLLDTLADQMLSIWMDRPRPSWC